MCEVGVWGGCVSCEGVGVLMCEVGVWGGGVRCDVERVGR